MVDITISVFKDAADAIDTVVGTLDKLIKLLTDAAHSGSDLIAWSTARSLKKKLSGVHSSSVVLWQSQTIVLKSRLEDFIANPAPEDWVALKGIFSGTLGEVRSISSELKADSKNLSTLPFFKDLLVTLGERELVLSKLLDEKVTPQTKEQLDALKAFLLRYVALIEQLGILTDRIADFINRLRADGKWPIKGD
jgi:hypothetical protein